MSSQPANNGDEKVAEFISKAAAEKTEVKNETYKHKYKWRGEEITILVILYAISVSLAVWGLKTDMNIGMFIASGIALVLAIAVTHLGASRKHKSRLIATYSETTGDFTVEGNGYKPKDNTVKIPQVTRVFVKKKATRVDDIDPKDLLVLSKDSGKGGVEIPMRLAGRPGLIDFLEELSKKANPKGDAKIDEFFEAAKAYKG